MAITCWSENFADLSGYTLGGVGSIFSVVADGPNSVLRVASLGAGSSFALGPVSGLTGPMVALQFRVKASATVTDDSCGLFVLDGAGETIVGLLPRSVPSWDAARGPSILLAAGAHLSVGAGPLLADEWYVVKFALTPGLLGSSLVITKESDSSVFATVQFTAPPAVAANLRFFVDSTAPTSITWFGAVRVCEKVVPTPPPPVIPPPTVPKPPVITPPLPRPAVLQISPDAIRARGTGTRPVSLRYTSAGKLGLWDHAAQAFVDLSTDVPKGTTVWRELPFDELPPKVQEYVRLLSRRTYTREQGSSPTYMAQLRDEAGRLLREIEHEHTSTLRNNVANRPSLQRKLIDIRTGGRNLQSRVPIR